MNKADLDLVVNGILGKASRDELAAHFSSLAGDRGQLALRMLEKALKERDAEEVDAGLMLWSLFGLQPEANAVLCELALAEWHTFHEDVVTALDELSQPASVATLQQVATRPFAYRDYDEARSLEVKAVRALASIPGADAEAALGRVADEGGPIVAAKARQLLQRRAGQA